MSESNFFDLLNELEDNSYPDYDDNSSPWENDAYSFPVQPDMQSGPLDEDPSFETPSSSPFNFTFPSAASLQKLSKKALISKIKSFSETIVQQQELILSLREQNSNINNNISEPLPSRVSRENNEILHNLRRQVADMNARIPKVQTATDPPTTPPTYNPPNAPATSKNNNNNRKTTINQTRTPTINKDSASTKSSTDEGIAMDIESQPQLQDKYRLALDTIARNNQKPRNIIALQLFDIPFCPIKEVRQKLFDWQIDFKHIYNLRWCSLKTLEIITDDEYLPLFSSILATNNIFSQKAPYLENPDSPILFRDMHRALIRTSNETAKSYFRTILDLALPYFTQMA
eukprot:Awhi_evm1s2419